MYTEKQWEKLSAWRQKELIALHTVIPDNRHGIKEGYYRHSDIIELLRKHKNNPDAVQFIADMLE